MAAESVNSFNVELLNDKNYHTWKFRMLTLLTEKEVVDAIKVEFKKEGYTEAEKKEMVEAQKMDNKSKSIIVQCLSDSQIDLIREKETAYSMWKTLEDRYEKKGIAGQMMLRKKLICIKLEEGGNLETFLAQFDEIIRQLKSTGAEIKESDLICNLLLAMPKSFETIIAIIENTPNEELTLEKVKSKLRAEAERRKASTNPSNASDSQRSATFMSNSFGTCYICGEKGHYKRNCPKVSQENQQGQTRGGYNNQLQGYGRGNNGTRGYGYGRWNSRARGYRGSYRGFRGGRYTQNSNRTSNHTENEAGNVTEEGRNEDDRGICFMLSTNEECNNVSTNNSEILNFYVDSGCTDHIVNEKKYFSELLILKNPIQIAVAEKTNFMEAIGVGNIKVKSETHNGEIECNIKNVFYVPTSRKNLLSVKRLGKAGIKVVFNDSNVKLYKDTNLIGLGNLKNLYDISFRVEYNECLNIETEYEQTKLWHRRLGHMCQGNLEKLVKGKLVNGIENLDIGKIEFCQSCVQGKLTRSRFGTRTVAKRLLEIVHTDIAGPITPIAYDGGKYFLTFIDDYSNFVCVFILKNKSEVFECFKEYVQLVQSKFNLKIATLRCDNGKEYISGEIKKYCRDNGTFIDYTVPYNPEQNGKAERFNRTLVEKARAMMQDTNMPKEFWCEAILTAAYLNNRSPTTANVNNVTPAEIWYDKKPTIEHLRIFGTVAYAHIPKELRKKFDATSEKCIMLGYTNTGYRLWNIEKEKVIISRNVVFNENENYYKRRFPWLNISDTRDDITDETDISEGKEENEQNKEQIIDKNNEGRRKIKQPERFNDYEMYMAFDAESFVNKVPECLEEINKRDDKEFWKNAMKREINSIEKNNTWKEVIKPENAEILNTRWVFATKSLEEKIEDRYKARLVVKGCAQKKTFDYNELYSPVAKMTTIRTLFSVGNQMGYFFKQLDVKTAFLNGNLNEDIYIYPPEGVNCATGMVLKLNKSLYGLKQASKCWNERINEFLLGLDFQRSDNDYCLYYKGKNDNLIYLLLYVDDMILTGPKIESIDECICDLKKEFDLKDQGMLKHFLGLEINYDRELGILKINQRTYLMNILKRFKFDNCNPSSIPIDPKLKLEINKNENNDEHLPVRELVGCLMYLMLGSRPDISFAINYFSRFQDKNSGEVWKHLKRVLRYLRGSIDFELVYKRNLNEDPMVCYVDSDWAGDLNDRKSVSGYLFKVYGNTVSWITRKQNCVALSSTEAELVALCTAVRDSLWLKKLLNDMNLNIQFIKVFEDNQACIALVRNPENNKRVKHIDLRFNFIYDHVHKNELKLEYVDSKNQVADILTKGTNKFQFQVNVEKLGLRIREGTK